MTLYPDVMRRAQGEIDNVVGRDRKPTFEDEDHLPYITAIVKEVLRWRPVAPLDALVFENIWAINHDSTYFPEPDEFRPERYLDSNGVLAEPLHDTHHHGHLSFGSGRRICIGQYFASQSLFIAIATILWAVNIEQALDSDGRPIIPSRTDTVDDGVVV
ncbi:hypothetical protein PHLCEN_2v7652 [Hermanssonia centrifuga]|uniref:Cytochrome P450 n=1 Tax=Hermanssonia centrifuga TaxID=98765 RepID=A0A2R6NW30_9APHY|nr:hypothetical protein PHLCEN_2v7652 [Hermanssonia centrifuga]